MVTLNNTEKVSIVINTYNGEKYLDKAINSCISQSYKNIEIIIWDNCSNDNTKKIVKYFNDKRIKYFFSNTHTSLYAARNKAIKKITGDYFCFLDCDDEFFKDKIYIQLNLLKKNNGKVSYSNLLIVKNFKKKKNIFIKSKKVDLF